VDPALSVTFWGWAVILNGTGDGVVVVVGSTGGGNARSGDMANNILLELNMSDSFFYM
jgi:hypothetical protein